MALLPVLLVEIIASRMCHTECLLRTNSSRRGVYERRNVELAAHSHKKAPVRILTDSLNTLVKHIKNRKINSHFFLSGERRKDVGDIKGAEIMRTEMRLES